MDEYFKSYIINDNLLYKANVVFNNKNKIFNSKIIIYPNTKKLLSYKLFWCKNNKILNSYTAIKSFNKRCNNHFEIKLNNCLAMPKYANGLCLIVNDNKYYFNITSDIIKRKTSKLLFEFAAFSDFHIESFTENIEHVKHLKSAFKAIKNKEKNCKFIISIGDQTNHGKQENYDCLNKIIKDENTLNIPIYFALGNHEYIYNKTYEESINRYFNNLNVKDVYYSFIYNDCKFIFLGSDSIVGEGTINDNHINWLINELNNTNKNMPTFIFIHQPFYNTISGSLKGQNWHGIDSGVKIKKLLDKYQNVFVFSGHTHWTLNSYKSILKKKNVTYINCASIGYLWNDDDRFIKGSEGLFVKIYENYVSVNGYEFTLNKRIGAAKFLIPLKKWYTISGDEICYQYLMIFIIT